MENPTLQTIWKKETEGSSFRFYHVMGDDWGDIQYIAHYTDKKENKWKLFIYYLDDEGYIKAYSPNKPENKKSDQCYAISDLAANWELDKIMDETDKELPITMFTFMNNPLAEMHGAMTGIGIIADDFKNYTRFKYMNAPLVNEMMEEIGLDFRVR